MTLDHYEAERQARKARLFELDNALQTTPVGQRKQIYRDLLPVVIWFEEHPDAYEQAIQQMSHRANEFDEDKAPIVWYGREIAVPVPGEAHYRCTMPECKFAARSLRVAVYHYLEHSPQTVEDFIAHHALTGKIQIVANTSHLFPAHSNLCHELKLERGGHATYAWLYLYTGQGITSLSLEEILPRLVAESEQYTDQKHEWVKAHKDELGEENAEQYYDYCEKIYWGLIGVLQHDLYQSLVEICQQ